MHLIAADWAATAMLPPTEVYVVNGFARSGTTWLQQNIARAIGAKTIFEPFTKHSPGFQGRTHALRGDCPAAQYFPYLDPPENMAQIRPYLDLIFRGYVDHEFGLKARDSWRDSLRRKLVVKFIRASLSLEGIHFLYGFPVVHIRRHPCAVISSYRAIEQEWGRRFDNPIIADILLAPSDGHKELFGKYQDTILRCDAGGMHTRIAAFWALSERYVDDRLSDAPWVQIVRYEDLVANPATEFAAILDFLGCEPDQIPDFNTDSAMTSKKRQGIPMRQRAEDWHTRLSTAEIDAVMAVVGELFPAFEKS